MSKVAQAQEVMPHGFLTLELAAKQYGTSVDAIRQMIYRYPLIVKKYRTGNVVLVRETDIEKLGHRKLVESV